MIVVVLIVIVVVDVVVGLTERERAKPAGDVIVNKPRGGVSIARYKGGEDGKSRDCLI